MQSWGSLDCHAHSAPAAVQGQPTQELARSSSTPLAGTTCCDSEVQENHKDIHKAKPKKACCSRNRNFVLKDFYFLDGFKHLSTIHIVSPTETCKKLKMSPQNSIPDFRTTIISLLAEHSTQIYELGSEHCHSLKPLNIVIAKYIRQS